jgi:hypothetical protein
MPTKEAAAIAMVAAVAGLICLPAAANGAPLEEVRIAISTSVDPPHAHPAEPITQLARVTNTGSRGLQQLIVELDARPGCSALIMVLPPERTATVTCAGTASTTHTVLAATVHGSSPIDGVIYARAVAHIDLVTLPGPPRPQPRSPSSTRGSPPQRSAPPATRTAPANPAAPVPAAPVPRAATAPRAAPAAPAAPASQAAPAVRAAAPPIPPPRDASRPAPPVLEPTANTGRPASPATARLPHRHTARRGPLAAPARYAAVVGLLGVTVMTISVGALTAALRVR